LEYKEHLKSILADHHEINPQVSIDLYSCIAPGTPGLSGLDNLYDNYRYVLPYMTMNFEEERYVKGLVYSFFV